MQEINKISFIDVCKKGIEIDLLDAIDNGANLQDVDSKGRSCLHIAASMGRDDLVKLLLQKGADVMARDCNGSTPLHYSGHEEVIKLLHEYGAELCSRNKQGYTAQDLMRRKGISSSALTLMEGLLKTFQSTASESRMQTPPGTTTKNASVLMEFYKDIGTCYMVLLLIAILIASLYVAYMVTGYEKDFSRIPVIDGDSGQKVEL